MAKKKIVLSVEVEMIIDEENYPPGQRSNADIEKLELYNWPEWILEAPIVSEKVTVTDYPAPAINAARERYYGDAIDCEPGGDDIRYDAEPGD